MTATESTFHWADYLVFILSLVVSLFIGVYFAWVDRKTTNTDDFLLGGRNMNFLPVSISLLASFTCAIGVIGCPAEIYYRGSMFLMCFFGVVFCALVTCFVFIPTFHDMKVTSAYEYFERRFGSVILRSMVSFTFALGLIVYMSLVLYLPALAFSEVSGIHISFSILTCGLACTIYTAIGGLKAVIWTDTIQMATVYIGLVVMIIMGIHSKEVGGPAEALAKAKAGGRLDLNVWDPDPRERHTMWSQVIGAPFIWTASFGTSQMAVQRYLSIEKKRDAQLALLAVTVGIFINFILIGMLALTVFAYYHDCDPYLDGSIAAGDQIVPRFLMDVMGHLHGLPGLLTAAVFSAALSTVSSAVNSLAAVTLEDFIKPIYEKTKHKKLTPIKSLWISRGLAIIFGLLTIALSFIAENFGDNVFTVVASVFGILGSPVLGCFTLGFVVAWCTSTGCLIGLIGGVAIGLWMKVGNILYGTPEKILPLFVYGCVDESLNATVNGSVGITTHRWDSIGSTVAADEYNSPIQGFYDISYAWYGFITWAVTVIVGVVVSIIEMRCDKKRFDALAATVEPSLMYDAASRACCCCPPGAKHAIMCGVAFTDDDSTIEDSDTASADYKKIPTSDVNGVEVAPELPEKPPMPWDNLRESVI